MIKRQTVILSFILLGIFVFQTGCVSSDDPNKRQKRALAGGATSTALGIATGVGGPMLAARALFGGASRVVTGGTMDKIKEKKTQTDNAEQSSVTKPVQEISKNN